MNIELHILQNFVPSCLNRDDTNAPKTATFGGVTRARISSQCYKRAMRLHMRDALSLPTGVRTRLLAGVPERLVARGRDLDEAKARTARGLAAAEFGTEGEDVRTKVGLYLAHDEIERLADAVEADWEALGQEPEKAEGTPARGRGKGKATGIEAPGVLAAVKAIGNRVKSADIALFGRMMAENTNMNVDAACQVAHAISTHEVETEMDFWTAVDDLQVKEETGALGMGNQEFQSACFYRYLLIQRPQLEANLDGDRALANRTVTALVRAAVEAVPIAKQNSTGAQNRPSYVQVIAGAELPMSLANAFERPVHRPRGGSLVGESIAQLTGYQAALRAAYDLVDHGQSRTLCVEPNGADLGGLGVPSQRALHDWLTAALEAD